MSKTDGVNRVEGGGGGQQLFEQCLKKTPEMVLRGIPNQPLHHVPLHHFPLQQCLYLSASVLRVPKPLWLYVVVEKCYKISWESISSPIQLRAREAESFQKARTSELLHLLRRDFFLGEILSALSHLKPEIE